MAEKINGFSREHVPGHYIYSEYVSDYSFPSAVVEITYVIRILYRLAVSSMVMNQACITVSAKEFHEREISFLVFAHSVGKLHHCLGFFRIRCCDQNADAQLV